MVLLIMALSMMAPTLDDVAFAFDDGTFDNGAFDDGTFDDDYFDDGACDDESFDLDEDTFEVAAPLPPAEDSTVLWAVVPYNGGAIKVYQNNCV